jgi:TonB family protein
MNIKIVSIKTGVFWFISILLLFLCFSNGIAQTSSNPCELTQCTLMDKKPKLIKAFPPQLSSETKKNKVPGMVVVKCVITKEGKTANIAITESDPPGLFNESVIQAVKKFEFSPALRDGAPIDVCVELPIKLNRNGNHN